MLYNVVQPYTTMYSLVQQCTALYNLVQPCTTMYNHVQPCTSIYNRVLTKFGKNWIRRSWVEEENRCLTRSQQKGSHDQILCSDWSRAKGRFLTLVGFYIPGHIFFHALQTHTKPTVYFEPSKSLYIKRIIPPPLLIVKYTMKKSTSLQESGTVLLLWTNQSAVFGHVTPAV